MSLGAIIVSILAAGAGVFGIKKGVDAHTNYKSAKNKNEKANRIYKSAKKNLKNEREKAAEKLEELGTLKLKIWDQQLGRFVALFERLKNVEIKGEIGVNDLKTINESLTELKNISFKAKEVISNGISSAGTGAIVGVASYGGATMLASASTGTAISSLSGAAATNATLAWFGGGSLASGGLGIAGGTCVLGGIVAAPVLAVGGLLFNANAEKQLATARKNYAKAKTAAEQMKTAAAICKGISRVCLIYIETINNFNQIIKNLLDQFEDIIENYQNKNILRKILSSFTKINIQYNKLSKEEKKKIHLTVQTIQVLKLLLETPLLTEDGALTNESSKALDKAEEFLTNQTIN